MTPKAKNPPDRSFAALQAVRAAIQERGEPIVTAAVHEAGHAVVALALGESVFRIQIAAGSGKCSHTGRKLEHVGVIAYAGAIGCARVAGSSQLARSRPIARVREPRGYRPRGSRGS